MGPLRLPTPHSSVRFLPNPGSSLPLTRAEPSGRSGLRVLGHRHTPPDLGTCPCPSPLTWQRQTRLSVTRYREGAGEARQGVILEPGKQAPGGGPPHTGDPKGSALLQQNGLQLS